MKLLNEVFKVVKQRLSSASSSKTRITREGQVVIIYLCRVEYLLPLYCTKTRLQLFSSSFTCCQIFLFILSFDIEFDAHGKHNYSAHDSISGIIIIQSCDI